MDDHLAELTGLREMLWWSEGGGLLDPCQQPVPQVTGGILAVPVQLGRKRGVVAVGLGLSTLLKLRLSPGLRTEDRLVLVGVGIRTFAFLTALLATLTSGTAPERTVSALGFACSDSADVVRSCAVASGGTRGGSPLP